MAPKKKILFIVEAMGGGIFTYLVDLTNELVDSYEIYIAYGVRPQTPSDFKEYFDKRIHLIKVNNFTREVPSLKDVKAFIEIKRIARSVRPDIIHLHSSKAGALGRWAFNGKDIPLFYTPHGYSFLMQDQSVWRRFIYRLIETVCARRKCTTISCSKGEYIETLKLTKDTTYVNNGINIVNIQKLLNSIKSSRNDTFTVFTLGRICYQKGPKWFNKIAQSMPDVKFLWIGDGEQRSELTAPNIEITGWLNRTEALSKAASADAFILTSLWEGLPISLLEAMYMKKPCIVSDVIGNRDVIQNGVNGYVCNNLSEFRYAIRQIMTENNDCIVNNAYQDILQKYNTKIMAKNYSDIYQSHLKFQRSRF